MSSYLKMNTNDKIDLFVDNLLETNRGFNFYVNWNNAEKYKEFNIELNAMNVLIRCSNMKDEFFKLIDKLPSIVTTFPLLFALSKNEREMIYKGQKNMVIADISEFNDENLKFDFSKDRSFKPFSQKEKENYYKFFKNIGLEHLFQNLLEQNVIDYVIGVLVGLDTNGRKNRGGKAFEDLCEPLIKKICEKNDIEVISQCSFKDLKNKNLISPVDLKNRRADFMLIKNNKAMNIEVNFYNAGGSKPEEIIDSYINRQNELKMENYAFALITDGMCWNNSSKNQLRKGFEYIPYFLNFHLAKNGALEEIILDYFN